MVRPRACLLRPAAFAGILLVSASSFAAAPVALSDPGLLSAVPGIDQVLGLATGPSGNWQSIPATGTAPPAGLNTHSAIYDPAKDRMLVYLGSDTWALSLDATLQWTKLAPGSVPPSRDHASAILDPPRHRMIVFGGYSALGYENAVWALSLDGTPTWSQILPSGTLPPGRLFASAIYDPVRDRMIVFGGINGPGLNDVWSLALSPPEAWVQLSPSGPPPRGRYGHVSVYDPSSDRMIIYGGVADGQPSGEVWGLSLGASPAWTSMSVSGTAPVPRAYATGVFDSANNRMIVYGGYDGSGGRSDTWALALDSSPAWAPLTPGGVAPNGRWLHTAVYQPSTGSMIVIGGSGNSDLRALTWGGAAPSPGPPVILSLFPNAGRIGDPVLIYGTSLASPVNVSFNGQSASVLSSDYYYIHTTVPSGATSGLVTVVTTYGTATSPDSFLIGDPPILLAAQPDSGKIDATVKILGHNFGTATSVSFTGPSLATFVVQSDSVISTAVTPSAQTGPVTVTNGFGTTTSSWQFRVLPWEPRPRILNVRDVANDQGGKVIVRWFASDYDAVRIKTVNRYRVWRRAPLEGASQTKIAAAGSDRGRIRVPIFTGGSSRDAAGEFWESIGEVPAAQLSGYAFTAPTLQDSLAGSNPYTAFFIQALTADALTYYSSSADSGYSVDNLSPPTPIPFVASYGATSNSLHWGRSSAPDLLEFRLYRGASAEFVPGPENLVAATTDTGFVDAAGSVTYKLTALDVHGNHSRYALVSPETPVATLVSSVAVDARADRIILTWYSGGNSGLVATVYRRTTTSDWVSLGEVVADGRGFLRFEDATVMAGTRYGFRLGVKDGGTELFAGEVWATAEASVFALGRVTPNPSRGGSFTVSFVLPTTEPARLALLDISGRRVVERDVGSLGPGPHAVVLGEGRRFPPGVYLVRLTQGRTTLTGRVVVLN